MSGAQFTMTATDTEAIVSRLERVEFLLQQLVDRQRVQDWYTLAEFSGIVGIGQQTLREYCRFGRLNAEKRMGGRGMHPSWVISHGELARYQKEGLLPDRRLA